MGRFKNFLHDFFGKPIDVDLAFSSDINSLYFKKLAIEQAVSIIAGAFSKCEIKFFYNGEQNDKTEDFYDWNIKPNTNESAAEFKAKIIKKLLTNGEVLIVESGKQKFVADGYSPIVDGMKSLRFELVTVENETFNKVFDRSEVCYIRLGCCKIRNLLDGVLSTYSDLLSANIQSNKRGKSAKWKLKANAMPKGSQTPEDKEKEKAMLQKKLKDFLSDAPNAVFTEFNGYELISVKNEAAVNAAKPSEITELRKDAFEVVAGAFKIPLSIFNGTQTNEQDKKRFQSECIEFIADIIEKELNAQTFSYDDWKNGSYVEVDTTTLESLDIDKLSHAAWEFISSGVMNVDEVRVRLLGLRALNTEYSTKYWITKNFVDIEKANEGGETNV